MPIPRKRTTVVEEFGSDSQKDGPTSAPLSRGKTTRKTPKLSVGTGDLAIETGPAGFDEIPGDNPSNIKVAMGEHPTSAWAAKNLVTIFGALFTIIVLGITGAWYVSKFDSGLNAVQEDLKDVKAKVDKSSLEITRQSVRLDYWERTVVPPDSSKTRMQTDKAAPTK